MRHNHPQAHCHVHNDYLDKAYIGLKFTCFSLSQCIAGLLFTIHSIVFIMNLLNHVILVSLLWQAVVQSSSILEMFEYFDYSARGFDCKEGDFVEKYVNW